MGSAEATELWGPLCAQEAEIPVSMSAEGGVVSCEVIKERPHVLGMRRWAKPHRSWNEGLEDHGCS